MTWEVIITSSITSTLVGIIVKLKADKSIKAVELKNKEAELRLSSILQNNKDGYTDLVNSLKRIWTELSKVEEHFMLGITKGFIWDPQWRVVRKALIDIRNETLMLPDDIHIMIEQFIVDVVEHSINEQGVKLKEMMSHVDYPSDGQVSPEKHAVIYSELSSSVSRLQGAYIAGRNELRGKLRNLAKEYQGSPDEIRLNA